MATSTHIIIGLIAAMLIIPAALITLKENRISLIAVGMMTLGIGTYWRLCCQSVELSNGTMTLRRLLSPTRQVSLSNVTAVRTLWEHTHRQFVFFSGNKKVGWLNPKLYSLDDLKVILHETLFYSPSASVDSDTSNFL